MDNTQENNNHEGINEEDEEYYDNDEDDENIMEDNQAIYDANKAEISPEEYDILLKKRE